MSKPVVENTRLSQLNDVLLAPILTLSLNDDSVTQLNAKSLLESDKQCCIVSATSTSNNTLTNIKSLYKSMSALKRLQKIFCYEYPSIHTSLIGIYPSLDYPACVYELNTDAERYVTGNVLPYAGSPFKSTVKYLISKLLGANPAVGGLGLILYKE